MTKQERNEQIVAEYSKGVALDEIAQRVGITKRSVWRILNKDNKQVLLCEVCNRKMFRSRKRHARCCRCRQTAKRWHKSCDCGCGELVPINWRYAAKCIPANMETLLKIREAACSNQPC